MTTKLYRSQHRELLRLAERVPVEGRMPTGFEVGLALARLKGVLGVHLRMEDDVLYPAMLAHPSADVREKAAKYQQEMGSLSATFGAFYEKWAAKAQIIDEDPQAFLREWRSVLRALRARIEAEESDLYQAVDAHVRLPALRPVF